MAGPFNLPFPSPFSIALPRRFVILGVTALVVFLLIHSFSSPSYSYSTPSSEDHYFSPSNWFPPIFSPGSDSRPAEFDEDGECLFLSPFDALSPAEKERARYLELETVSSGVVKSKKSEMGGEGEEGLEGVESAPAGLTHPILALLRDGEKKWNNLISSQSRTLEQAVATYVERWGRQPPKGFDLWWHFAQTHNVLLPDEYDAIMNSLRPFYALPVETLAQRAEEAEKIEETFTLIVKDGKVVLQWNDDYSRDWWWASRPRADSQINLMEPFLHELGNFRATFTIHDQPSILLDFERQHELLTAAKQHKVSTHPNEEDRFEQDWHKACSKDSPLSKGEKELGQTDTFISSHVDAMDICQHPSYLENHGNFIEAKDAKSHPKPHTKLFPIFVPSKTGLNGDIPVTPVGRDGRRDDVGNDPAWNKKSGKLYWRGLATGLNHNKGVGANWRNSHRERLHFLANDRTNDHVDILQPIGNTGEAEVTKLPKRQLGQYYMDVKLADGPWQCDNGDGTCDEMRKEIEFAPKDNAEKSNEFKYVFDTDGNAWSSRFPRLMAATNVVIKATVFPEWNTLSLPEWFAYVPSKMDYSDLFSIMSFFRGTPSGRGSHDEVARRIALNGQCWVEKTWRREDLQAYMFRLYLEYARLMSPDRDNGKMDYHLPSSHSTPAEEAPAGESEEKTEEKPALPEIEA